MTLQNIQDFLMWCTIINSALLILSTIMIALLRKQVYKIHGRLFKLSEEQISITLYRFLGLYKILIFVFNLVPWLAIYLVK
jgi:Family of unknown function (DUF6868)